MPWRDRRPGSTIREELDDVEGGTLTLRGVGHGGQGTARRLGVKLGQVGGYSGEAGGGLKLGEFFGLKVPMIASHSGS